MEASHARGISDSITDELGTTHQSSDDEFTALLEAELEDREDDPTVSPAFRDQPAEPSETVQPASKRQRIGAAEGDGPLCPPHPGHMHGICIRCGQAVAGAADDHVALRYIHHGLQITKAEAERIRRQSLQRSQERQKLLLVLDLDHTLLNSTRFTEVSAEDNKRLQEILNQQEGQSGQSLFRLPHMAMWTKLRPHVREFLEGVHAMAEMHIYTHGDRDYAAAMALLLDPKRRFFQERIISQSDSTQRHTKDLDVMLGAESAVVILDDTKGVWRNHRDNLIQVERYLFFPADAQRFHSSQPSLFERGAEESAEEGQLSICLRVLQKLHQRVFGQQAGLTKATPDVREHLKRLKAEVLHDVRICFTKIIPLAMAGPEHHPLWRLAELLGAHCSLSLTKDITHVVAGGPNTEKAVQARASGIPVVSPDWLYASDMQQLCQERASAGFLWKAMSEEQFPVRDESAARIRSEAAEVKAALAAAGGGRGADSEESADGT